MPSCARFVPTRVSCVRLMQRMSQEFNACLVRSIHRCMFTRMNAFKPVSALMSPTRTPIRSQIKNYARPASIIAISAKMMAPHALIVRLTSISTTKHVLLKKTVPLALLESSQINQQVKDFVRRVFLLAKLVISTQILVRHVSPAFISTVTKTHAFPYAHPHSSMTYQQCHALNAHLPATHAKGQPPTAHPASNPFTNYSRIASFRPNAVWATLQIPPPEIASPVHCLAPTVHTTTIKLFAISARTPLCFIRALAPISVHKARLTTCPESA
jgi:hypothetical protein